MKVPFFNLTQQIAAIRAEVEAALGEVIDSGQFILGSKVEELEKKVAAYCGWPYGLGVSSGTDALLLSLMAMNVGPGSLVLTTPFSFFATAGVIVRLGATPVFVDIDPATFNLNPLELEKALNSIQTCDPKSHPLPSAISSRMPAVSCQPKVILPVHLYGRQADMQALNGLARDFGLRVIEDGAQAIGSTKIPLGAGEGENLYCLSFFPTKNLGAMGDGGMILAENAELLETLRLLRVHGAKTKYVHPLVGGNFRLDAFQAAVLLVKINYLEAWTQTRRANARYYDGLFRQTDLVDGGLITLPSINGKSANQDLKPHVYNQYVIRAEKRDALREYLQSQGIGTEVYYPLPLHLQPCFEYLGYRAGDFPEAEKAAREVLALPIFPELTKAQQEEVVQEIDHFYQRRIP